MKTFILIAFSVALSSLAHAATGFNIHRFDNWALGCRTNDPTECGLMSMNANPAPNDLQTRITSYSKEDGLQMSLRTPKLVDSMVVITVDGELMGKAVMNCDADSCFDLFNLNEKQIALLSGGQKLIVNAAVTKNTVATKDIYEFPLGEQLRTGLLMLIEQTSAR